MPTQKKLDVSFKQRLERGREDHMSAQFHCWDIGGDLHPTSTQFKGFCKSLESIGQVVWPKSLNISHLDSFRLSYPKPTGCHRTVFLVFLVCCNQSCEMLAVSRNCSLRLLLSIE